MMRRSAGYRASALSALLLVIAAVVGRAEPEARAAFDNERWSAQAALQSHDARLPFIGTSGPVVELAAERQLRLAGSVRTHSGTEREDGQASVRETSRSLQQARAAEAARLDACPTLSRACMGLPERRNTPPPVSIS